MARLRGSEQASLVTALTCGYAIWFPDYHNLGKDIGSTVDGPANIFFYSETDSDQAPLPNVTATPQGSEDNWETKTTSKSLQGYRDPAAEFVASDMVQDARTLSACMSLTYTGKMQDSSGELCFIENFPLEALLANVGGNETAPSVDSMFNYATKQLRFGTDKHEVLARPGDASHIFKSVEDALLDITPLGPAQRSYVPQATIAHQPRAIGFAWRGLTPSIGDTTPLTFTFTKNVEWRPKTISGLTHTPPTVLHPQPVAHAVAGALDRKHPGWAARVVDGLASGIGKLANAAFTGAMQNPAGLATIGNMFKGSGGRASLGAIEGEILPLLTML